jgi:magnesium transporter
MSRHHKKRHHKAGLSPGSLVYTGEPRTDTVTLSYIAYTPTRIKEGAFTRPEECFPFRDETGVSWLNLEGIQDVAEVEKIGAYFHIHPLTLEDVVSTFQRPKIEDFGEYQYLVLKMLSHDVQSSVLQMEQVSLVFGRNYLVCFQEGAVGDVFPPVRERLRNEQGRLRRSGPDYLAYALLDVVVDNYFIILEHIGETIEDLQNRLIENPEQEALHQIQHLKRELLTLRKAAWPLREVVSAMERSESPLIQDSTKLYLRDVYDHIIQVIDTVETYREMLSGMLDIYLSSVSNRMNAVMKVLTVIATIFMPLTFIAGVYGMNFRYMPELGSRWGYPGALVTMVIVGVGMVAWFRRRKWL